MVIFTLYSLTRHIAFAAATVFTVATQPPRLEPLYLYLSPFLLVPPSPSQDRFPGGEPRPPTPALHLLPTLPLKGRGEVRPPLLSNFLGLWDLVHMAPREFSARCTSPQEKHPQHISYKTHPENLEQGVYSISRSTTNISIYKVHLDYWRKIVETSPRFPPPP
jgi:hypothetical protein